MEGLREKPEGFWSVGVRQKECGRDRLRRETSSWGLDVFTSVPGSGRAVWAGLRARSPREPKDTRSGYAGVLPQMASRPRDGVGKQRGLRASQSPSGTPPPAAADAGPGGPQRGRRRLCWGLSGIPDPPPRPLSARSPPRDGPRRPRRRPVSPSVESAPAQGTEA